MTGPLLTHEVPNGAGWSALVRAGRWVRLTALAGGANCSTLLFAAHDPVDRMNIPDTLKAQMSARCRPPMVLMSDRGVGLASVVESSLDWHDCVNGHSASAEERLLSELRKHGRSELDLHACINFFSKVAVDKAGRFTFVPSYSAAGAHVVLRAEVDLLVVLVTAAHPLDPDPTPGAVRVEVLPGAAYGDEDPSMTFRDESARALTAAKAVFA